MNNQALFSLKDKSKKSKCRLLQFLLGALRIKDTFSAYMRRVASIITSNKHTLSLFLTSKDSLILVIRSVIKPLHSSLYLYGNQRSLYDPADSLSQITIYQ